MSSSHGAGFAIVPAEVLGLGNGYAIAVYAAIAQHANRNGEAFPSVRRIGEITGWSAPTNRKGIRVLEEAGLVVTTRRTKHGEKDRFKTSNLYYLPLHGAKRPESRMETSFPTMDDSSPQLETSFPSISKPPFHPDGNDVSTNKTQLTQTQLTRADDASAPDQLVEAFEAFWNAYPSGHGNRKKALEHWRQLKPDATTQAAIMAGLERWKRSKRWQDRYIKAADIWLRDRWWEDEPPDMAPPIVPNDKPPEKLRIVEPEVEAEGNPLAHLLKALEEKEAKHGSQRSP